MRTAIHQGHCTLNQNNSKTKNILLLSLWFVLSLWLCTSLNLNISSLLWPQSSTLGPSASRQLKLALDPRTVTFKKAKMNDSTFHCKSSWVPLENLDSFYGRTIYMIGDSTVRMQFVQVCGMVTGKSCYEDIWDSLVINQDIENRKNFYDSQSLKKIKEDVRLIDDPQRKLRVAFLYQPWYDPQGLEIMHTSLIAHNNKMQQQTPTKPDTLYFNGGLHYLQLAPVNPFRFWNVWRDAEMLIIDFLEKALIFLPKGARVVYMNSHAICEDKYVGKWRDVVQEWRQDPATFSQKCVKMLQVIKGKNGWVDNSNETDACLRSTFTTPGVVDLNHRVESALAATVDRLNLPNVGCVDSFALTVDRCEDTFDGRHYPKRVTYLLSSLEKVINEF